MIAYVYILRCSDDTLYTGWTYDIDKRIAAHNNGSGAKYTRGRTPVSLFYSEKFDTKEEALSREIQIKKLKRYEKILLTES
ncbi:MAG: GIY-YIG nuclease family protein [Synergistaceae bacterium]|nr:GIY-YIG nuclease family protein [Synergistaceae bacterium]